MPNQPAAQPDRYACVVALHQCRRCRKITETPIAECRNGLLRHCGEVMAFKSHRKPCACPSCTSR